MSGLRSRSWILPAGATALGATLLSVPAFRFRPDLTRCNSNWPSLVEGRLYMAVYAAALALLTVGWLGLASAMGAPSSRAHDGGVRGGPRHPALWSVIGLGVLLHSISLISPPFLSEDPLCYVAIARATGVFHADARTPLLHALPPDDPFLRDLNPLWQTMGSVYGAGFNAIARALGSIAPSSRRVLFLLFEIMSLLSVLLSALLIGLAVRALRLRGRSPPGLGPEDPRLPITTRADLAAAHAAALIIFCPLSIIEGTVNMHNDVLLMVSTALFVLCLAYDRKWLGLLALSSGLLFKSSVMLVLGPYLLYLLHGEVGRHLTGRRVLLMGTVLLGSALAATPWILRKSEALSLLIGSPDAPYDYCTRSVECLPRVLLRWVAGSAEAAWVVGLLFRAMGAAWLLYVTCRACRDRRFLPWAGAGLFVYYLYLHGWSQSWYLLALLPLLPFADRRFSSAMKVLCISALAYYVVDIQCITHPLWLALGNAAGAVVTIIPPSLILVRDLMRERAETVARAAIAAPVFESARRDGARKATSSQESCVSFQSTQQDGPL